MSAGRGYRGGCILSNRHSFHQFHSSGLALPSPGRRGNLPSTPANCQDLPSLKTCERTHADRAGCERGDPGARHPSLGSPGRAPERSCPPIPGAARNLESRLLRGPRLEGAAGGGDSGCLRRSLSRVGSRGGQSAGRGWGGEAGVPRGGDRKGRRGGEGRAGGGGYKPHALKRRALSIGGAHSPPPYTPPLMAAIDATPTLKATRRSDCNGRDCWSGEALVPDSLNFHCHPPQATKRRPHTPARSHTCCLPISANHERPDYASANQNEAVLHPCRGTASLANRRQLWGRGEGESDGRREGVGLRNWGGGAFLVGGKVGRREQEREEEGRRQESGAGLGVWLGAEELWESGRAR